MGENYELVLNLKMKMTYLAKQWPDLVSEVEGVIQERVS